MTIENWWKKRRIVQSHNHLNGLNGDLLALSMIVFLPPTAQRNEWNQKHGWNYALPTTVVEEMSAGSFLARQMKLRLLWLESGREFLVDSLCLQKCWSQTVLFNRSWQRKLLLILDNQHADKNAFPVLTCRCDNRILQSSIALKSHLLWSIGSGEVMKSSIETDGWQSRQKG